MSIIIDRDRKDINGNWKSSNRKKVRICQRRGLMTKTFLPSTRKSLHNLHCLRNSPVLSTCGRQIMNKSRWKKSTMPMDINEWTQTLSRQRFSVFKIRMSWRWKRMKFPRESPSRSRDKSLKYFQQLMLPIQYAWLSSEHPTLSMFTLIQNELIFFRSFPIRRLEQIVDSVSVAARGEKTLKHGHREIKTTSFVSDLHNQFTFAADVSKVPGKKFNYFSRSPNSHNISLDPFWLIKLTKKRGICLMHHCDRESF